MYTHPYLWISRKYSSFSLSFSALELVCRFFRVCVCFFSPSLPQICRTSQTRRSRLAPFAGRSIDEITPAPRKGSNVPFLYWKCSDTAILSARILIPIDLRGRFSKSSESEQRSGLWAREHSGCVVFIAG